MDRLELLAQYRCPRYEDFPNISLYKDQVVSFLTEAVSPFYEHEQAPVTAAMINNYVKLKVISPPERKKYTREQVICLYVTFLLKQVLRMEEIRTLLEREFSPDRLIASYSCFTQLLEGTIARLIQGEPLPVSVQPSLLEAAIRSFLYRRYAVTLLREPATDSAPIAPLPPSEEDTEANTE